MFLKRGLSGLLLVLAGACGDDTAPRPDAAPLPDAGAVDGRCGEAGCGPVGECARDEDCAGNDRGERCHPETRLCVHCVNASHCASGETCNAMGVCELPCGPGDSCPAGHFCAVLGTVKLCLKKQCESNAECKDPERPRCDTTQFACVEPESPGAKPELLYFRASPPLLPIDVELPVTFTFAFKAAPDPAPTCSIDGGVGPVELVQEQQQTKVFKVKVAGPIPLPQSFTLTCENKAGKATAIAVVSGLPVFSHAATLPKGGGSIALGPYSIVVPPDALDADTEVTVALATSFEASPNYFGPVLDLKPEGLAFKNPVTLTIPYDESVMQAAGWAGLDPKRMRIGSRRTPTAPWRPLLTSVDAQAKTLTAKVSHFSGSGAQEEKRPEGWHPLGASRTKEADVCLLRQQELLVRSSPAKSPGALYDDERHSYAELHSETRLRGEEFLMDSVAGDLDGDGADELVEAILFERMRNGNKRYYALAVNAYKWKGKLGYQPMMGGLDTRQSTVFNPQATEHSFYQVKLALAAVDGDLKKKRIAVVASWGDYHLPRDGQHGPDLDRVHMKARSEAWVLRYRNDSEGFVPENNTTFRNMLNGTVDADVAAGNVAGDEKDELVFVGLEPDGVNRKAAAWIWRFDGVGFLLARKLSNEWGSVLFSSTHGRHVRQPRVVVAQFDDDPVLEIAFAGAVAYGNPTLRVELFNDANHTGPHGKVAHIDIPGANWLATHPRLQTIATNLNGNRAAEIVIGYAGKGTEQTKCGAFGSCSTEVTTITVLHTAFTWHSEDKAFTPTERETVHTAGKGARFWLAPGTLRKDGQEAFFLALHDPKQKKLTVRSWAGKKTGSGKDAKWSLVEEGKSWTLAVDEPRCQPMLAVGDYDRDDTRVRWTGEVVTDTADPLVMVVMAVPPYKKGTDQNVSYMSTAYGKETSSSATATTEVGLKAGVTVSWSGQYDPFGIVKYQVQAALSYELTSSNSTTESWSYGRRHSILADEEGGGAVIFTSQTYDSYRYEVLSHTDPDRDPSKSENRYITLDDPNYEPNLHRWSIAYFNANNGKAPDIGTETFKHTPGEPMSYPTKADKDALVKNGAWVTNGGQPIPVTQGTGYDEQSITVSKATGQSKSHSFGVELSYGLTIANTLGMSASVGFNASWAYEVSCGQDTQYSGTVGAMKNDYGAHKYKWGLMVHDLERKDQKGYRYQVINYWTEPF